MYKKLINGIGANILIFLVSLLSQLVLLPIMTTEWGVERYGVWILISTVPTYLGLGDFGFATAAANDMTIKVAQENKSDALDVFQSIFLFSSLITVLTLVIILTGFSLILPESSSSSSIWYVDNKVTLAVMMIYGIVSLQGGAFQAGFRCSGNYALGTSLIALTMMVESTATVMAVLLGYGLSTVSMSLVVLRVMSLFTQYACLRAKVPWLQVGFQRASFLQLKHLAGSALPIMILPLSQALFLQGTALAVGLAGSPSAVVIFTAVRTLTRTPVQFVNLINHALLPEVTKSSAREKHNQLIIFVFLTAFLSLITATAALTILLFFGQELIRIWSHGKIFVPYSLLLLMSFSMILNSTWQPLSNLLLSINKQASYTYTLLVLSLFTALLTYFLVFIIGANGAGFSILIFDTCMFIHILVMVDRHLLQRKGFIQSFKYIRGRIKIATKRQPFLYSEEQH